MIEKGNPRVRGLALALALAPLALTACGSDSGNTVTAAKLSAADGTHLAELSDRVASDLDSGDTCSAAHAADDLQAAIQDARLPDQIRTNVESVASRLVDEVNCPAPPPPPTTTDKHPDDHGDHGDQGNHDEHPQPPKPPDHHPPGHGGEPPGHAKIGNTQ